MRTSEAAPESEPTNPGSRRLAFLLAMAMFALVVDTSLMNVSILAVIGDLDATASWVQSAIALETLVSAACSDADGRTSSGCWPTRSVRSP